MLYPILKSHADESTRVINLLKAYVSRGMFGVVHRMEDFSVLDADELFTGPHYVQHTIKREKSKYPGDVFRVLTNMMILSTFIYDMGTYRENEAVKIIKAYPRVIIETYLTMQCMPGQQDTLVHFDVKPEMRDTLIMNRATAYLLMMYKRAGIEMDAVIHYAAGVLGHDNSQAGLFGVHVAIAYGEHWYFSKQRLPCHPAFIMCCMFHHGTSNIDDWRHVWKVLSNAYWVREKLYPPRQGPLTISEVTKTILGVNNSLNVPGTLLAGEHASTVSIGPAEMTKMMIKSGLFARARLDAAAVKKCSSRIIAQLICGPNAVSQDGLLDVLVVVPKPVSDDPRSTLVPANILLDVLSTIC